jgi:DNA/RNA-binding protein KIN17
LQEAALKKERSTMSDEQRERLLIAEQIERAKAEEEQATPDSESPPPVEEGLKRDEGAEKVVLSFSAKPVASTTTASSGGLKLNTNPLKVGTNPLKRPNVFKATAFGPTPSTSTSAGSKRPVPPQSAAERLMFEDQERKRRKMEREAA